jgi:hypothetical protein
MDRWTRLGIEAYRSGNRAQAQRFFRYALMEKPDDVRCWLWLVEVVDTDLERIHCLEQVLKIDPNHALARKALEDMSDRIESTRLPHVSPFGGYGSEEEGPEPTPASVEVRSTPPFMAAMAGKEAHETDAQPDPSHSSGRRASLWRIFWFILVGFAILAILGFLIFH